MAIQSAEALDAAHRRGSGRLSRSKSSRSAAGRLDGRTPATKMARRYGHIGIEAHREAVAALDPAVRRTSGAPPGGQVVLTPNRSRAAARLTRKIPVNSKTQFILTPSSRVLMTTSK
jgi:hypothetical protein